MRDGRRRGLIPKAAPPLASPIPKPRRTSPIPEAGSKLKDGFAQAFNAQATVDAKAQIVVAQDVTQDANDKTGPASFKSRL